MKPLRGRDPLAGQLILDNRLPPSYPQRLALETAIRKGLAGLHGDWQIVVQASSSRALVVGVVAPDGSAWSLSCNNPEQRPPESIADTVRAACNRRRWLKPATRQGSGDDHT